MTKQIIMTSPVNFAVQYEINPWMTDNVGSIDRVKAAQQWNNLRNALVSLGVDVVVTDAPPEYCPDAVFTANAGLIYKNDFILSMFRHEERIVEEPYFGLWMKKFFNLIVTESHPPEPRSKLSFEGAGDALFDTRDNLWLGTGFRTSLSYKFVLDKIFSDTNIIVRALELIDPRFYHLDTCFCPLDTGEVLWYPPAFSEYSQYVIEGMFADKAIVVPTEDAVRFACNAISVGKSIVLPTTTPFLVQVLTSRGYNVVEVDMSEFMKSGGACKCLTLEVR